MTDADFTAAVESADTYKTAAVALNYPYQALYTRAVKLKAYPKAIAAKRARKAPEPQIAPDPVRPPAPEAEPVILSAWQTPPAGCAVAARVLEVRLDQHGRVRAYIADLDTGWVSWAIFDANGERVGKPGIDGAIEIGRRRVDERLVALGWLHEGQVDTLAPCSVAVPTCDPLAAPADDELAKRAGFAAHGAARAGWSEEQFVALARQCFRREAKHAA